MRIEDCMAHSSSECGPGTQQMDVICLGPDKVIWQTTGQNITNIFKNVKIVDFNRYIWIRSEKRIQISTNMPSIGSVDLEIDIMNLDMTYHGRFYTIYIFYHPTKNAIVFSVKYFLLDLAYCAVIEDSVN